MENADRKTPALLTRRGWVRVISFTAALVVALTAAALSGYSLARKNRTMIEYAYQRALGELNDYVANIDITLEKGKYAASASQLEGLSAKLWREAGLAKNTLGQLPVDAAELSNTYKFLSQVGNFCRALSEQVAQGGAITDEEAANMRQLSEYARTISGQIAQMQSNLEAGRLDLGEVAAVMGDQKSEDVPAHINDGFHEMEEGFEDYPTLLYDGPFSDHIQQQEPRLLKARDAVSAETALEEAKKLTGNRSLAADGETRGNLPCYIFGADTLQVGVTKTGGIVQSFLNSRTINEAHLSIEQALDKGMQALEKMGYTGFAQRYYDLNNGVLTINYACREDDVVFYPDLVKLGIAMDNGEIVRFDATGYIMNHTARTLPAVKVAREQALARLSPLLTAKGEAGLALIPTDGGTEMLCHEFHCEGADGDQVLVYVDVTTGEEERILILVENETGVLTL